MVQVEIKYETDKELQETLSALRSKFTIKKIPTPKKIDKWYKVWIKLF